MPEDPKLTPEAVLDTLLEGNRRWVNGRPEQVQRSAERRPELVQGQEPMATVFTCIDSRVAPEIVFDCAIGELAVIRTGAHVPDQSVVLGSLEFGASVLGTPLLLVMGHESCGATRAAIDAIEGGDEAPGALQSIVDALRPAYQATAGRDDLVDRMVREHSRLTAQALAAHRTLAPLIAQGTLAVRAAHYALGSGEVSILD